MSVVSFFKPLFTQPKLPKHILSQTTILVYRYIWKTDRKTKGEQKWTALIDFDGQGHSSIIYGVKNINKLEMTINALLRKIMEDEPLPEPDNYVIKEPDL